MCVCLGGWGESGGGVGEELKYFKCITVGTLSAQLLQFYTNFETLQALLSWSVDVLVVWALWSI